MNYDNPDLQELRKLGYGDIADEIVKALKSWDDSLATRRASVTEDYLRGRIGVHAHIKVRIVGASDPPHDYCIRYQVDTKRFHSEDENILWPVPDPSSAISSRFNRADGKRAVLVDSVQFVNLPEWVRGGVVPSLVRLQLLDDCTRGRSDTTNLLRFDCRVPRLSAEDGKFRTDDVLIPHIRRESQCECHSQVIESRPEIEKAITNDCAEPQRDGVDALDSESPSLMSWEQRLQRWFWVWFINDCAGFALDPCADFLIESLDMFACPL